MTDLNTLTSKELVGMHNNLNPDFPLKYWKGKKELLIKRINILREAIEAEEAKRVAPTKKEAKAKASALAVRTIRAAAIEHLCHTAFYEDYDKKPGPDNTVEESMEGSRSVGLPYDEILRRLKEEFPKCKTSVACLRWYAVKIRVEEHGYEGLRLPQRRPRAKPAIR